MLQGYLMYISSSVSSPWRLIGIPVLVNHLLDKSLLDLRGNLCTNESLESFFRKAGIDNLA
jgi:hypothetical protein